MDERDANDGGHLKWTLKPSIADHDCLRSSIVGIPSGFGSWKADWAGKRLFIAGRCMSFQIWTLGLIVNDGTVLARKGLNVLYVTRRWRAEDQLTVAGLRSCLRSAESESSKQFN